MENQTIPTNKVAAVTAYFWIMKVLATTLGEVLGDFFSMTLNMGYVASLFLTVFVFIILLSIQLKVRRFYGLLYWLVIIGTATVGTEISDMMDRTFGLGYTLGSAILFLSLLSVLFIWYLREKEIKVYPVTAPRVELFYWSAILLSNSLGTAFGDFLSDNLGLSYMAGAAITAAIILVVLLLHYYSSLHPLLLFWIAFIFTRPFGATFGDLLTKPLAKGGLNFGRGMASVITALLLLWILYFSNRPKRT